MIKHLKQLFCKHVYKIESVEQLEGGRINVGAYRFVGLEYPDGRIVHTNRRWRWQNVGVTRVCISCGKKKITKEEIAKND